MSVGSYSSRKNAKRGRSDTVFSDSHDQKRARILICCTPAKSMRTRVFELYLAQN